MQVSPNRVTIGRPEDAKLRVRGTSADASFQRQERLGVCKGRNQTQKNGFTAKCCHSTRSNSDKGRNRAAFVPPTPVVVRRPGSHDLCSFGCWRPVNPRGGPYDYLSLVFSHLTLISVREKHDSTHFREYRFIKRFIERSSIVHGWNSDPGTMGPT
ncbi:hypothetical protein BJX63DRAFT_199216 [Aspergillus granulosus]|uniref:Uncharacterized protein n=1 Tax=Aspergillus granulosus TaxID=176169 RepID=A0ABR4HGA2_9EURO